MAPKIHLHRNPDFVGETVEFMAEWYRKGFDFHLHSDEDSNMASSPVTAGGPRASPWGRRPVPPAAKKFASNLVCFYKETQSVGISGSNNLPGDILSAPPGVRETLLAGRAEAMAASGSTAAAAVSGGVVGGVSGGVEVVTTEDHGGPNAVDRAVVDGRDAPRSLFNETTADFLIREYAEELINLERVLECY